MTANMDRLSALLDQIEQDGRQAGTADAEAEIADLTATVQRQAGDLTAAKQTHDADAAALAQAQGELATTKAALSASKAEAADLKARLDACLAEVPTDPPPPPPPTPEWAGMLYGANDSDWASLQGKMPAGHELQSRRFYDGTFPSAPSARMVEDWNRDVVPWVSFSGPSIATINSGSFDATIISFWKACTKKCIVTYIHEVDNGKGAAADYVKALKRIGALKRQHCPNNEAVLFGPCYMAYTFQTGAGGPWLPSDAGDYIDVLGSDPYRYWRPAYSPDLNTPAPGAGGTKRSMEYLLGPIPGLARTLGIPIAIGEYGAHPDPADKQDRPKWLRETDTFLRANNCVLAEYFHAPYGGRGPWYLDRFHTFAPEGDAARKNGPADPDSIAAYAALIV